MLPSEGRKYCNNSECLLTARRAAAKVHADSVRKALPLCKGCGVTTPNRNRLYCDSPGCRKAAKGLHLIGRPTTDKMRAAMTRPRSLETRARMSAAMKARPVNPAKGRPKSLAWRIQMSERMRNRKMGFWYRHSYFRKDGREVRCRSRWEWATLKWLDSKDIPWEYEPLTLVVGDETYLPDILRLDTRRFIEVKGYLKDDEAKKLARFQKVYRIDIWDEKKLRSLGVLEFLPPKSSNKA